MDTDAILQAFWFYVAGLPVIILSFVVGVVGLIWYLFKKGK